MFPPEKIFVPSDSNELELSSTIPKNKNQKENTYIYSYTKSITKMGMTLPISETELKRYLNNKIFLEL